MCLESVSLGRIKHSPETKDIRKFTIVVLHQIRIAKARFKRCQEKSTRLLCDSRQDFWGWIILFQLFKVESLSIAETEVAIHRQSTVLEVDGSFKVSQFFNVEHQLFKHPRGVLEALTGELVVLSLIESLSGKSGGEIVKMRENFKLGILRWNLRFCERISPLEIESEVNLEDSLVIYETYWGVLLISGKQFLDAFEVFKVAEDKLTKAGSLRQELILQLELRVDVVLRISVNTRCLISGLLGQLKLGQNVLPVLVTFQGLLWHCLTICMNEVWLRISYKPALL